MNNLLLNVANISLVNRNQILKSNQSFALKDISFSLAENNSISLIGDSASGKTSLIMALLKLKPISSGKIFYKGKDINLFSKTELVQYRRNIQPVFQNYEESLNPLLTIQNNLYYGFSNRLTKKEKLLKLNNLVNLMGLNNNILSKLPFQLSGGEKQRITIIRALVTEPEMIILDEPFSSLDVINQEKLLAVFQQIKSEFKVSYIFITHKIPLIKYFSDSIFSINKGKMQKLENYRAYENLKND